MSGMDCEKCMAWRLLSFQENSLWGKICEIKLTACKISSYKSCQKEKENGKSLLDCSWVKKAMFPYGLLLQR